MTAKTVLTPTASQVASDALVVFGITGDLASKQIFPALYAMCKHGTLDVPVIGVASSDWGPEQLHVRAPGGGSHQSEKVRTVILRWMAEPTPLRRLR